MAWLMVKTWAFCSQHGAHANDLAPTHEWRRVLVAAAKARCFEVYRDTSASVKANRPPGQVPGTFQLNEKRPP